MLFISKSARTLARDSLSFLLFNLIDFKGIHTG